MLRPLSLILIGSCAMLAACATVPARRQAPPPGNAASAVAVTFDRAHIAEVVVEGLADRDTGRAATADDPVRIASISKLVMALAALRLVEEGRLDLDDDVARYLGWRLRHPAYPDAPVSLRQILMHRAGLRDDAGYVVPLGESLQAKLADPQAWFAGAAPGAAPFEYANLGSPVVATVLEAASGERYDRLVARTVFAPLGIAGCLNWIGCAPEQAARAVVLYRASGEVARDGEGDRPPNCTIPVTEGAACTLDGYVPGTNASIFSPQGGVRISMRDLARLGQAILTEDPHLLGTAGFAQLKAMPQPMVGNAPWFCHYGLALQTLRPGVPGCADDLFADGRVRYGHAGEAYGLRSGLWIDPDREEGIAYFVTGVPEPASEDTGGFAEQERVLVARALAEDAKR